MSKRIYIGIAVITGIIIMGIFIQFAGISNRSASMPLQTLDIATMPHSFTGYTIFLAYNKGYFKSQGLDVHLKKTYPHGMATLKALTDGEVQIAASSETPFMNSILKGAKLSVIATTITADEHLAIIARKDSGILAPKDLKNKSIGVTMGSNGEYFLDIVLNLNNLSREDIRTVNLEPGQMVEKLMAKGVDAIATWNPQKVEAIKALGKDGVIFDAEGLYSPLFIIATTQAFARSNPEIIKKVLRALLSASRFIEENPDESHMIVAGDIKTVPDLLKKMTATYHFKLSLDQSFLTTLENQAAWSLKQKSGASSGIPDFLDFIYFNALEEIDPDSVTIIR